MKKQTLMGFLTGLALAFNFSIAHAAELSTTDLKAGIKPTNVGLPRMVDEETRLDRIEAGAGEVVYFYTLINYSYDQLNWNTVKESVFKASKINYCEGAQMAAFRDNNVDMLYMYYDKNGEMAGTVKIPRSSCAE